MTGRILHTSDWHLGRQLGRHRRDTEVDAVLDEIIDIADDFAPDLIVHSGDLFDTSRPGLDDLRRAAQALRRLGAIAPVVVVAGNHDTRNVLAFLEFILNGMGVGEGEQARVRFATDARPDGLLVADYPAQDGELTLRIGALPYLHPNRFAYDFTDPALTTATYAERLRTVQADVYRRLAAGRGARDVLVFAAHLFVEGALPPTRSGRSPSPTTTRQPPPTCPTSPTAPSATSTNRSVSSAPDTRPTTPAAPCRWTSARAATPRAWSWPRSAQPARPASNSCP
ncbi:exonuclease subunit SbcD [Streptomyces noursei]|uniref:metallophosphoesterase family protein n=1 Tax=Streptomyces noursei TaxID=1971 RepID=UPI0021A48B99|nr:exonuclease subunit SbcD [Streptomyces noursei]UWS69830.1 exonuclease subunit SbcD [Streptomyces noursei]UWS76949.1 exonuclease subunit SbcD [Streptomyces noursei]